MENDLDTQFEKMLSLNSNCEIKIIKADEVEKIKPAVGEGGFGKVYRGRYKDNDVAIKKIKVNEKDKAVYQDISNEINVVAKADNENIPKFYGLWKDKKNHYNLIFEFIDGKNLKDIYKELDYKKKIEVCYCLTKIIRQFHEKKLIHRDIKPANVMLTHSGKTMLIDFGISKIAKNTSTYTKVQIGTIPYMAPEMYDLDPDMFMDDEAEDVKPVPVGIHSDIWSLGCLISEVFSGYKPWCSKKDKKVNDIKIQNNLLKFRPFPIPSELDDDIKDIVGMCMKNNVEERATAVEIEKKLEELLNKNK